MMSHVINTLIPQSSQADYFEYNYLVHQYKTKSPSEKDLLERVNKRFLSYQSSGILFAAFAMLSYRRYAGTHLSFKVKLPVDTVIVFGSFLVSSNFALASAIEDLSELRRSLLKSTDVDYIRHMVSKYNKFEFLQQHEYTIYSDVMTRAEYKEWKEHSGFDIREFKGL